MYFWRYRTASTAIDIYWDNALHSLCKVLSTDKTHNAKNTVQPGWLKYLVIGTALFKRKEFFPPFTVIATSHTCKGRRVHCSYSLYATSTRSMWALFELWETPDSAWHPWAAEMRTAPDPSPPPARGSVRTSHSNKARNTFIFQLD
jgi:hypothetical protein